MAQLEPVPLPIRTSLYTPDQVPRYLHFITSGIASVVTSMANGDSIEVGLVGHEGAPELIGLLGPAHSVNDCFIQVEATGLRIDFKRFQKEFFSVESVRTVILQHIQYSSLITSQIAACNRLHEVEERLARWLLMVADRLGTNRFTLTQEFLAEMIGSRRSTVTVAAGIFKRAGFIDYRRGEMNIENREALENATCECYAVTLKLLRSIQAPELMN